MRKIRIESPRPLRGYREFLVKQDVTTVAGNLIKRWIYEVPESRTTDAIRLGGEIAGEVT